MPWLRRTPARGGRSGSLRHIRLVQEPLTLEEFPRSVRRDGAAPQGSIRLELAPDLGWDFGCRWRLVVTGVQFVLEIVEDRLDLFNGAVDRPGVAPGRPADLRALPDGDEKLVRDAAAVEVLRGLGDEVGPPQHLAWETRLSTERSVQDGLDGGRVTCSVVLDLHGVQPLALVVVGVIDVRLGKVGEQDLAVALWLFAQVLNGVRP
jgi:hypothetical protein